MGLAPNSLATTIVDPPLDAQYPVPKSWTLEEAATVPAVYMTVYYGLIIRAQLEEGESILIHSAAGGVGQAAIRVAQSLNCKIYVTVGTEEKREFMKKTFPQLTDSAIFNSRDIQFENQIKMATQGRGVDVVLNSLAGDKMIASVRCVAEHGRFVEIGKYDLFMNNPLGEYHYY